MRHVNLETLANGAFSAQVNRAFKEVTENIQDPNTDALAKRKVTVTITFKPNKDRNFAPIDIQTKTALAPAAGMDTALSMGKGSPYRRGGCCRGYDGSDSWADVYRGCTGSTGICRWPAV